MTQAQERNGEDCGSNSDPVWGEWGPQPHQSYIRAKAKSRHCSNEMHPVQCTMKYLNFCHRLLADSPQPVDSKLRTSFLKAVMKHSRVIKIQASRMPKHACANGVVHTESLTAIMDGMSNY